MKNNTLGPIDPQLREVLEELARGGTLPIADLTPQAARLQPSPENAVIAVRTRHPFRFATAPFPEPVGAISHRTIPSVDGREVVLRFYTPRSARAPYPVLVYFHGGGFVIGDIDRYDATCRALANRACTLVVSVGYHQAPEFPFPAAPEDAFAAYRWILAHAAEVGGDPTLVAVSGESAGGNLATVTAMIARDRGVALPIHQTLIYPMLGCNFETPAYRHFSVAAPLDTPTMRWYWSHYLANAADADNPYAVPMCAKELHGLPPTTIVAAMIDPVWSDAALYSQRLEAAGVSVRFHNFAGMTHDFVSMAPVLEQARQAIGIIADDLGETIMALTEPR